MPTQAEDLQAKEFLKRAEIRTMRKDLLALREIDALKERDKIAKIKTLEEQMQEEQQKLKAEAEKQKVGVQEVLTQNEGQEKIAEKDLKNYATEQERQQIFLLESQRLGFEKESDAIDNEKDPALKLQKNNLLIQKRGLQSKLDAIIADEKKLEEEQKFIVEKAQTTTIPEEKKALEARRWEIDKQIQEIEKKRWAAEKEIEDVDSKITQTDKSLEQLVLDKNILRDKILGVDKSLREIYSIVITRIEDQRKGALAEQVAKREAVAKVRLEEKENVQREQWSSLAPKKPSGDTLSKAPQALRDKIIKSAEKEEQDRTQFLHDIELTPQQNQTEPSEIIPPVPPKRK